MFEDPLTADYPSRQAREEEEEAASRRDDQVFDALPSFLWAPEAERLMATEGHVPVRVLVLATSPSACALLDSAPGLGQALGSLVMEDVDMAGNTLIPSSTDRTCWIHKLETRLQGSVGPVPGPQGTTGRESEEGPTGAASPGQLGGTGQGTGDLEDAGPRVDAVAVLCRYLVPQERAFAMARGLLSGIKPQRAVILADIPAGDYVGPGDPTQGPMFYLLQSGSGFDEPGSTPSLPVGTLVTGFAAAAFSRLRAQGIPTALLTTVSHSPALDAASLGTLALHAAHLLDAAGLDGRTCIVPAEAGRAARACQAALRIQNRKAQPVVFV